MPSPTTRPRSRCPPWLTPLRASRARLLRKEYPAHIRKYLWGGHFWSPSYFVASCGGAPLSIIKEYIENQKRPDQRPNRNPSQGSDSSRA
ncbi:transposase [Sphaerisporangium sp. NPDC051017]|uniref:transposase n=1 Tax=Sphaerisporangium sp. NPDC051017 TaxID=3154636 RepID=UPI0034201169